MKRIADLFIITLAFLMISSGSALAYGGVEGNINLLMGQKFLDDDLWDDLEVDEQLALGLMLDVKPAGLPFSIALDFLKTEDSYDYYYYNDFEDAGETWEIDLGIRFYTNPNIVRLYVGGGLALIKGEITLQDAYVVGNVLYIDEYSEDDEAAGFWVNGGLVFTVARHLNLGVDMRYSQAEIELFGEDVNAGGLTLSGFVGFHF